jgi:carbamoyltransferase
MKIWGITAQTHDAAIAVIENGEILFASSAERYSKIKQDHNINKSLIEDALFYGKPDIVSYYENTWIKKGRQILSGQFSYAFDLFRLPQIYLKNYGINCDIECVLHHKSHAAAGFYTSPYKEAAVVVIDSLGEWQTISIWKADGSGLFLLEEVSFPSSLGLLYSAFTKRVGLKPNEEEYILMGMAAYGKPIYVDRILNDFIDQRYLFRLKKHCHMGIGDYLSDANNEDLAASIQVVAEQAVNKIVAFAKKRWSY